VDRVPYDRPVRREVASDAMLLGAVLLWSFNVPLVKVAVGALDPLAFAALRFAVGASTLLVFVRVTEGGLDIRRADLPRIVIAAALGVTLQQVLFVLGLAAGTASSTSILFATTPLWTALIAMVVGLERPGRRTWVTLAFGIVGVALVVRGSPVPGGDGSLVGDLLILASALAWASYSVIITPLLGRYSANRVSAAVTVTGTLALVPLGLPALLATDLAAVPVEIWAIVAYAALGALVLTNLLYFTAVRNVGASRAAAFIYLQPVFGVVLALLLLGESITPLQVTGGAVVFASILAGRRLPRREGIVASEPDV
jgi:drug/metabolite transporter (DMT)-like permease